MAKIIAKSPLAPLELPVVASMAGVALAAGYAALRYPAGRDDLLCVTLAPATTMAGVFTRSRTASPAIAWCQQAMAASGSRAQALVVAAGNSLAGTGADGVAACRQIAVAVAAHAGCAADQVQVAATGVIGEPFPVDRLVKGLTGLRPVDFLAAALAISTTDTFPKLVSCTADIGGAPVTVTGFIKGSGMIQPDMATMLGFLFADAAVAPDVLQAALDSANATTFSCITVDSDTSTSDCVLLFATGASGHKVLPEQAPDFAELIETVCLQLAQLVVRDGEGAQKFITVHVSGAEDFAAARQIGLAIANSPLVKTAIAGGDANWGRVVMAVGKAGAAVDPDALMISFGSTLICREGTRVSDYDEAPVVAHLAGQDVHVHVDVGVGDGTAQVFTCDLTHGYISINADYRS